MKYIEIIAPCCVSGKNYSTADLIPETSISGTDTDIILGVGLARFVERPEIVEKPEDAETPAPEEKPAKNTKKAAKK